MLPEWVVKHFWDNVIKQNSEECWVWKGGTQSKGYGTFNRLLAHRVSYILHKGQMEDNLVIDHLCRNKLCVNPNHLEAVSNKENLKRGTGPIAVKLNQTHCSKGHELLGYNLMLSKNGKRRCRLCFNAWHVERRKRVSKLPERIENDPRSSTQTS